MSLLAAMAVLTAAPAACLHAIAMGAGVGVVEDAAEHASHHHDHGAQAPTNHAPAKHADHGCADDCDGGADCNGCAIGSMALLTDIASPAAKPFPERSISLADERHGFSPGLDTPPPRA